MESDKVMNIIKQVASQNKLVEYRIEQDGQCTIPSPPPPQNITASYFSTALNIMELATAGGERYAFKAEYTEEIFSGLIITAVGGVTTVEPCVWLFYVRSPDGTEIRPEARVSSYIPADGFTVILRYKERRSSISIRYSIKYTPHCSGDAPLDVMVETFGGITPLDVMERAVVLKGRMYEFTVSYQSASVGYTIQRLNGKMTHENCSWVPFITPSDGQEVPLGDSLASFVFSTDHTLTLRYTEPNVVTTDKV